MEATAAAPSLKLPIAVVSPTDIARLTKELESLDEFFRQSEIRSGGAPQSIPRYSRLLDEVVLANKLNLLQSDDREKLANSFQNLNDTAPVLHISFSVDPPGPYVQKIVDWLRTNIEATILVRVGLQPNIGAGCVVRTPNHSLDFSLRKYFESKHEFFMEKLHEVVAEEQMRGSTVATDNPAESTEPQNSETSSPEAVESAEKTTPAPVPVNVVEQEVKVETQN